jgi:GT2 family glycosyltransferase
MRSDEPMVLEARRGAQPAETGLVSVIVPCFGQLEHTRICVPRILRYTRSPFEIVFVDAGALDGTSEYLSGVAAIPSVHAEVVQVSPEIGLLPVCAAGLERAQGEYIVFVSNDTVVGERWLNHLVAAAKLAPDIGMVGTMSNMTPPPQWVGKLPYRVGSRRNGSLNGAEGRIANASYNGGPLDLAPVDAFAREWREQHAGKSFEVERLGGSCLLLKAELCKKIDFGDASTPFGAIDGDLLSAKVREAGYRLVCCRDLFLHHFGSRLFAALRVDPVVRTNGITIASAPATGIAR